MQLSLYISPMKTIITLLVILLSIASSAKANFAFTPTLQQAYEHIQELRLTQAKQIIATAKNKDHHNGIIYYLENYHDLHNLLLSEEKASYNCYLKDVSNRYDWVESLSESPYKQFILAELKLHTAFAKLKFGNEISGCRDIIKAYSLLTQNHKQYPTFIPQLKSLGLLHVLIGCVPDKYNWVTKLLGLEGNIDQGIRELRQVQVNSPIFKHEATLIDYMLHAYVLDNNAQITSKLQQWCNSSPDNLLLHFLTVAILKKEGKTEEALQVMNSSPSGSDYLPLPVMQYMKAELLLHQGKHPLAVKQYELFLQQYRGANFVKDSYYKIFIGYWLTNQTEKGRKYLEKVTTLGSTVTEADQFAQRFAEQYLANKVSDEVKPLYMARYYSDGGYQQKAKMALQEFNENSFSTDLAKAELNYRRGRIYQKSGTPSQSIAFYKRAITLSEPHSYYFGASAALQLGYIYQDNKQIASARTYFKKAIAFKKHEYKNSIDNKAKAALQKLK